MVSIMSKKKVFDGPKHKQILLLSSYL